MELNFLKIIGLEADAMYTKVSTINDGTILVSKPLKFFIDLMQNIKNFYKPHRSFLINLMHIKEYVKKDGGYILMENNKTVSISKDKKVLGVESKPLRKIFKGFRSSKRHFRSLPLNYL